MNIMKDFVMPCAVAASLAVGGWGIKQVGDYAALSEKVDGLQKQVDLTKKELAETKEDMNLVHEIDGELHGLVTEVKGLREDFRVILPRLK